MVYLLAIRTIAERRLGQKLATEGDASRRAKQRLGEAVTWSAAVTKSRLIPGSVPKRLCGGGCLSWHGLRLVAV